MRLHPQHIVSVTFVLVVVDWRGFYSISVTYSASVTEGTSELAGGQPSALEVFHPLNLSVLQQIELLPCILVDV